MNGDVANGIIDECAKEALKAFTSKNWRTISPNALMLVLFAIEKNREKKIVRLIKGPLYFFCTVMASGLIWLVVRDCFNLG